MYVSHTIGRQCKTNKENTKEVESIDDGGSESWILEIIRCMIHLPHHGQLMGGINPSGALKDQNHVGKEQR